MKNVAGIILLVISSLCLISSGHEKKCKLSVNINMDTHLINEVVLVRENQQKLGITGYTKENLFGFRPYWDTLVPGAYKLVISGDFAKKEIPVQIHLDTSLTIPNVFGLYLKDSVSKAEMIAADTVMFIHSYGGCFSQHREAYTLTKYPAGYKIYKEGNEKVWMVSEDMIDDLYHISNISKKSQKAGGSTYYDLIVLKVGHVVNLIDLETMPRINFDAFAQKWLK